MGKITQEQIKSINSKCLNDWRLDTEYFIFHNEKTLIKHIQLDNEHYLEFKLRYNYKNQISLHISKFYHKQGDYFASSNGLGKNKVLNETQAKRKNVNDLIEFTKTLTDDELMQINKNTEVTKSCMFVASEQF
ncbi:MAG: hypothetical protein J6A89_04390 [Clostridia bacterium]|nr:hypothetical protein [Clostridia bacterium]